MVDAPLPHDKQAVEIALRFVSRLERSTLVTGEVYGATGGETPF